MDVKVITESFECPACNRRYSKHGEANACFQGHIRSFQKQSPRYRVGVSVLTHLHNNPHDYTENTVIVRIDGELWESKLLVENENGERYFVPTCRYQTNDLASGEDRFHFVPLV